MEPKIVTRDQFMIVGLEYVGKNENAEIAKMWGVLMPRHEDIKNATNEQVWYGLCECMCEGECKCGQGADFRYIAGTEVSNLDEIPEGMVGKTIPAAKYAVFTHRGSLESLPMTFHNIYAKWIPEAGLAPNSNYGFELYDERFKDFAEDSEIDIYVPVG